MAGETSRINGKKGGRPTGAVSLTTRTAMEAKAWFAQQVHDNIEPIFRALVAKAAEGDVAAIRELLDRGWGKAIQQVDVTSKGEQIAAVTPEVLISLQEFEDNLRKNL